MAVIASRIDPDTGARPPLGVLAIVRESLALLVGAFLPLVGTSLLLAGIRVVGTYGLRQLAAGAGIDLMLQQSMRQGVAPSVASGVASAALLALSILTFALTHLVLLDIALKRQAGEPVRAAAVARSALRYALPMSAAYVAVWVLITLGFVALVVPGLWLVGVYSVVSAVILAEDRRRGFLGRTRQLTKDYRWPLVAVVGFIYLAILTLALLSIGAGKLFPALVNPVSAPLIALSLLVGCVVDGLSAAISAAAVAPAYRRLRRIKEGGGDLKAVFD